MSRDKGRNGQATKRTKRLPLRSLTLLAGSLLLLLALSLVDLAPNLSHLDARISSGQPSGNYHAIASSLRAAAAKEGGTLDVIESAGSVANLERLIANRDNCQSHFALVQDGIEVENMGSLELIARLPKRESLFILGRNIDAIDSFADLRGLRIGIGPEGSGTDQLMRTLFGKGDLAPLGVRFFNRQPKRQLEEVARGELDLAAYVLDEDADFIRQKVREGWHILSLDHIDVIARRHSALGHGRIGAGQFDPIALLPKRDLRVVRVDTLVVGNACASRSETIALLGLLQRQYPALVEHNRMRGASTLYQTSDAAHAFFLNGQAEWADEHVPWLVDIMPLSNWFYLVMAVSVLFNIMGAVHRFRLWRIDTNRDRAQQLVRDALGAKLTPYEISKLEPRTEDYKAGVTQKLDEAVAKLDALREVCRRHENSPMVPMGQELAYRYQEEQMELSLGAVRAFRAKLAKPSPSNLGEGRIEASDLSEERDSESQGNAPDEKQSESPTR